MLPGILACNQRPGSPSVRGLFCSNLFLTDRHTTTTTTSSRIPTPRIVKTWEFALDKVSVQKNGTVGGNSEQVIEKEQISAADERDIIEAALQEITIDKNNVAKYIEKEHNSAQTYWFDY